MRGIYTALATPFTEQGEVDYVALQAILDQQTRLGIRGFVVCGTTGESPTLSREEKVTLFQFVYDYAAGKALDLVAGTGTNDTRESIALTLLAEKIGYRRFLVVVPYYNKPSQEGLRQHFRAIADGCLEASSEVILYNVPGRTGISLAVDTIVELASHPKIRAIKEASGNVQFLKDLVQSLKTAGASLSLLSGDDATYLPFLQAGGEGVISVSSHVCPTGMLELEAAVAKKDFASAEKIHAKYLPIFTDLFVEANPCPLKWVLAKLGLGKNRLRLPLVPVQSSSSAKLDELMNRYEVVAGELRAK